MRYANTRAVRRCYKYPDVAKYYFHVFLGTFAVRSSSLLLAAKPIILRQHLALQSAAERRTTALVLDMFKTSAVVRRSRKLKVVHVDSLSHLTRHRIVLGDQSTLCLALTYFSSRTESAGLIAVSVTAIFR